MKNGLTILELSKYLDEFLGTNKIIDKYAKNGLIVSRDVTKKVIKIAFSVDASLESFKKAALLGCNFIIVHHSILYKVETFLNHNYERMKYLMENNLSLYVSHIPLDVHPIVGNNVILAKMIDAKPIGFYEGGLFARLSKKKNSLTDIKKTYDIIFSSDSKLLDFSSLDDSFLDVKNVLICSGSGSSVLREYLSNPIKFESDTNIMDGKSEIYQSNQSHQKLSKIELFITGEFDHSIYHIAKENNVSVLFLGHYLSEMTGIKALMKHIDDKFDMKSRFIDIKTGL